MKYFDREWVPWTTKPGQKLVSLDQRLLTEPLRWRKSQIVLVPYVFDQRLSNTELDKIFAAMALAPRHRFLLVTEMPVQATHYFRQRMVRPGDIWPKEVWEQMHNIVHSTRQSWPTPTTTKWPLENVGIGVRAGAQFAIDNRVPPLLTVPAAFRFLYAMPLVEEVDVHAYLHLKQGVGVPYRVLVDDALAEAGPRLDWIVAGGSEHCSVKLPWLRFLALQARCAGIPLRFTMLGPNPTGDEFDCDECHGKGWHTVDDKQRKCVCRTSQGRPIKSPHGTLVADFPQDLRIFQFIGEKVTS